MTQEFRYGQPVIAQHKDGSALFGRWQGQRLQLAGMPAFIAEGLEREGYVFVAAKGAVLTTTSALQALPNGSVVLGNERAAQKVAGTWWLSGLPGGVASASLWDYLLAEIAVLHVPEVGK